MSQKELHKIFEIYGSIQSAKISKNSDHSSKGYAYIQFKDEDSATDAISQGAHMPPDKLVAMPYRKEEKKPVGLGNNLYIKNIPDSWDKPRLE